MSVLISTALGSLLAGRYGAQRERALGALLTGLAALTVFYLYGMGAVTEAFLGSPLAVRIAVTAAMLAPLGLALGAFMPLGLGAVASLTSHSGAYVAWAWAVNGFFSVLGSVLTTVLSMSYGFRAVLLLGLAAYVLATALLFGLSRGRGSEPARAGSA